MRKLFFILAICLTICSKANAKDVVTGDDFANLMADYSVGEAYNIYLNRQKYPSTEKFLEMFLLAIKGASVKIAYDVSDSETVAYIIYDLEIERELPLFYRKVEEGRIHGGDSFFLSAMTYFLLRAYSEISEKDLDSVLKDKYTNIYEEFVKIVKVESFLEQWVNNGKWELPLQKRLNTMYTCVKLTSWVMVAQAFNVLALCIPNFFCMR